MKDTEVIKRYNAIVERNERTKAKLRIKQNSANIGKCYRFENSYGCLERKTWWLYRRIIGVTEDGWPIVVEFQTDDDGKFSCRKDNYCMIMSVGNMSDCEEISVNVFKHEFRKQITTMRKKFMMMM